VARPAVEQVWVEPGGRLQVLDFPLPTGAGGVALTPVPAAPGPLPFVRQVASLALEGKPRAETGRVAAPIPPHASGILDKLFQVGGAGYSGLGPLRVDLEESHAHPPQVSYGMRAAHLGVQGLFLATGLFVMLALSGLFTFWMALEAVAEPYGWEQVRDAIRAPAERDKFVARADAELVDRPGDRDRVKQALAPDRAAETVRRFDDRIARTRGEAEAWRAGLTRPEQSLLGAWEKTVVMAEGSADTVPVSTLAIYLELAESDIGWRFGPPFRVKLGIGSAAFILVWPLGWAVFAFVFRGGLAMNLVGITLVRADGTPAGRWRCALRELLGWVPFTSLLLLCLWVQVAYPGWVSGRVGLWLIAALMLPASVLVAMRDPARTPQDRLVGTYLVPV
jgi:hypothetical protein